ncbi:EF-hand calcium-binding domain-containing protein 10-like [Watersipora subatra]|uniref:EF-hand calcium-binding domain-containing protein 10-like n=1 Tax=Watersipora subatra TaxID=2589382 RepID=UPI00355BFB88
MAAKDRTNAFIDEKEQNGNPREKEALEYIKKHKIVELFDNFTAQMLFTRPSDPRVFLMERLQKLIKSRAVNLDPPAHFDKTNIDSVFGMMDPTKKGFINVEQYKAGMTTLGISEFDHSPPGTQLDKISMDTFGREARKGVAKEAATYYAKPDPRSI